MRAKQHRTKESRSHEEEQKECKLKDPVSRIDACYELINMITGAGMGMAGGSAGLGMLRARRRDISIKPNRKLDRKSSRGMIYENEELRLRTIHINAEVEQGQNDIKKLRRENEQLRREIWSLRDEYDKLEEILKKQRSREESDEPEGRSDDEAAGSEHSEDGEEDDDEEDVDDEEFESEDETDEENNQDERLENAENQKISSENLNNTTGQRTRRNFEDLAVVKEEDEFKKEKDKKDSCSSRELSRVNLSQKLPPTQQNHLAYHTDPLTNTSSDYQANCPFVFPTSEKASGSSNIVPMDRSCLLTTACPQQYSGNGNQQPVIPLASLNATTSTQNSALDINTHNHSRPPLIATSPPPAGWQSSVSMLPAGGSSITASNFPLVTRALSPARDSRLASSNDLPLKPPEDMRVAENGQAIVYSSYSKLTNTPGLAERRRAFFKQHTDNFGASGPRYTDNGSLDSPNNTPGNCDPERKNRLERSIDDEETMNGENMMLNASMSIDNSRRRHFFAPLPAKSGFPYNGENGIGSMDDSATTRLSDSGNSPSSEKTDSTVILRSCYDCEKGSADICVNGAIPSNIGSQIEKGDAKAFFSSENLLIVEDVRMHGSSNGSSNLLTKSVSCQDLSPRLSFTENLKFSNTEQHAKSDNTLDSISISSKAYRSQMNMTLKPPRTQKSSSPDTPEIPKLPSIDYKLFNNPFLQHFEQAYQNFPVRMEGPSPVTHPLSIQVCESPVPGPSYSSPIKVQPSFSGPSVTEPDCGTCKRKDLERLRLMIPPSKLLDQNGDRQEYQVTSFETPSPHTLQIPPMTPYELEALRGMPTVTTPVPQTSRLYQNVPFEPRGAAVYCPGQGIRMYYDTVSMKVPAQTQTSLEDEPTKTETESKNMTSNATSNQLTPDLGKKRHSRKDKLGSLKEKKSPGSQRRKVLKKQKIISSKDIPESPEKLSVKTRAGKNQDDKNESRSSSSGQESPKKDQTKRVSLYLSTKKRPSFSSVRTSRSRSVENARERQLARDEAFEGNATNSERERTNSISSREAAAREKTRKTSTSSGSVPWCACWGNGCI